AERAGARRPLESISPLRRGFFIPGAMRRRCATDRTPRDRELRAALRAAPARREGVERMAAAVRTARPPNAGRVHPRTRRALNRRHRLRPPNVDQLPRQSSCKVDAGSTRANRAPGIHDASPAAARSAAITAAKVNASVGATPNSSVDSARVAASATTAPIAAPAEANASP